VSSGRSTFRSAKPTYPPQARPCSPPIGRFPQPTSATVPPLERTVATPAIPPTTPVMNAHATGWSQMVRSPADIEIGQGGSPFLTGLTWQQWRATYSNGTGKLHELHNPNCHPVPLCPYDVYNVKVYLHRVITHRGRGCVQPHALDVWPRRPRPVPETDQHRILGLLTGEAELPLASPSCGLIKTRPVRPKCASSRNMHGARRAAHALGFGMSAPDRSRPCLMGVPKCQWTSSNWWTIRTWRRYARILGRSTSRSALSIVRASRGEALTGNRW